ncbi:hypothetical protein EJ03DRAFT_385844 [Teratosphaeria nubilosa]|uniref:Uncharacterized protein n=1 Tax=Teratosphaeria nubilosa TaxID=161662 RepID=A0A6G1KVM0_9PEZI|nr:hypothetical protein EJ03DRAFT_385844 [Teratosphaeria nubilosa]
MAGVMGAHEFLAEKPLPNLPGSPTLTNPDMVLPLSGAKFPVLAGPPHSAKKIRPPSPSYLRDKTNEGPQYARTPAGSGVSQEKEKRGFMSRKMMLSRSRTGSATSQRQAAPRSTSKTSGRMEVDDVEYNSKALASSPTLIDVENLAAEQSAQGLGRRSSTGGSSSTSEDYVDVPTFWSKYHTNDSSLALTVDEASDNDTQSRRPMGHNVTIGGDYDAQRRQQEEDELNSAILSKRAEQILANAKKRLNLMEGNLRGARDLVQPLTTANLKRATSLGHQHSSSFSGKGGRFMPEGYRYDTALQQPIRTLHSQASSPAIGRDYAGHSRICSGNIEIPERSHSAMSRGNSFSRHGRIPVRPSGEGSWNTPGLRNSRSYDSIALNHSDVHTMPAAPAWIERTMRHRASPEPNLAPLIEDDSSYYAGRRTVSAADRHPAQQQQRIGLGIYDRPSSRTEELKDQISGLKGKISNLKERAREDSLRRQSLLNLRAPIPFNNATSNAPEFYYMKDQNRASPPLNSNGGYASQKNSPGERMDHEPWERRSPPPAESRKAFAERQYVSRPGSRNAFAEQFAQHIKSGRGTPFQNQRGPNASDDISPGSSKAQRKPSNGFAPTSISPKPPVEHKRTPSGTAIIESADKRFFHRQASYSQETQARNLRYGEAIAPEESPYVSPMTLDASFDSDSDLEGEDMMSIYEDAADQQLALVPHEDRDDAFDYEHFFLHSAMGSYSNGRPKSYTSDDSVSSDETTRAPAYALDQYHDEDFFDDEKFNPASGIFPPPTPETPERLKEIERNLRLERGMHKRGLSSDSTSTMATYATADEGPVSPPSPSRQTSMNWPITPTFSSQPSNAPAPSATVAWPTSRPLSRHSNRSNNSRPSTAIKRLDPPIIEQRRDSSSERADSGVGLDRRSNGDRDRTTDTKRRPAVLLNNSNTAQRSPYSALSSPPMSPGLMVLQDPATIAVNALLDPTGRALGLKDKALLFEVVESLRKVTHRLQEEEDAQHHSRLLRRKLEDAKRALNGTLNARPGTS